MHEEDLKLHLSPTSVLVGPPQNALLRGRAWAAATMAAHAGGTGTRWAGGSWMRSGGKRAVDEASEGG
jgi:hypothetical protein